jgi:hypothetical protein
MNPYLLKKSPLAVLAFAVVVASGELLPAAPGAPATNDVLFADDFEHGLSGDWLQAKKVDVVAEGNNHFARMTEDRALLNSPPTRPNVPKSVPPDELARWASYEWSFRFRVGNPAAPDGQSRGGPILQVTWNISPSVENKYECRMFYLTNWLPTQTWFGNGPMIPWYGKNVPFDGTPIKKGIFQFSAPRPKVTGDWQGVRIRQQAGRSQIFFNDELVFDGSDMRAEAGGFALMANWEKDRYDPQHVDIDDVKAVRLVPEPPAAK